MFYLKNFINTESTGKSLVLFYRKKLKRFSKSTIFVDFEFYSAFDDETSACL